MPVRPVRDLLIDGARTWHRLWSVRMAILSSLLGTAACLLPALFPEMEPLPLSLLSVACSLGAVFARLVKQPDLHKEKTDA